jgi:ribulose bisphosphate carboxylase small subunit
MAKSARTDILAALKTDRNARAKAIKMLARDFPKEYLKFVKLDPKKVTRVTPTVLVSDKEWQE